MENDNYDVEGQGCSVFSGKHSYFARSCCVVFVLIICVIFVFSVIFTFNQRPVDLNLANSTTANFTKEESTSSKKTFSSLLTRRQFTFEDLFSGKQFLTDGYDYIWLPDGSFVLDPIPGIKTVSKIPLKSSNSTHFLDEARYSRTLSSNSKYAYKSMVTQQMWRRSADYMYDIVRIKNGSASQEQWHVGPEENSTIQLFYWNPNKNSHDFVYVHNHNLYYQKDPEKPESAIQLTVDGNTFNRFGLSNWLYEEEILESADAVWWSPSGRYVSYLRFDDREVNRIFLPKYTNEDNYVEYIELPYPKAGVLNNTLVTQYIWDSDNHKIVETAPPNELSSANGNYYVLGNTWITMPQNSMELGKERLITVWSNREQNHVYFSLCNELDCVMTLSFPFKIDNRSLWAQPKDVRGIFQTKRGFLTLLPHKHEDGNIYNHVAHVELDKNGIGKITRWIGEDYDVITIVGYSMESDTLSVTAYGTGIGNNGVYTLNGALYGEKKNTLFNLGEDIGKCDSMKASADPTGERLAVECEVPFENTRLYLVEASDPSKRILLRGNETALIPFDIPTMKFGKFKLPSGIDGHYMLMIPPNLPEGLKVPLFLDVYGGPDSKNVIRKTSSAVPIWLSSGLDVVYARIDVRGTGGRGWNVKEPVYKNLGEAETIDTLDMIRAFVNSLNFIDEDRIAVMGWSYGGFLSAKVAAKDQGELVKCVISIAPVTDFKYYDTAYTERYLGDPEENAKGYEGTNLIPHARNLTNVKYFLAHGEKDDNVHYQNSARWSEALQKQMIHFRQLVYANEGHSLQGKLGHMYSELQDFLVNDCFKLTTDLF